jgi:predicted phosphodiesterase
MKYALMSDIHANLPALEAVLDDLDRRSELDAIYHLGDLVGYGPWPNEVVARLRYRAVAGVAGNYDSTTATDYPHCGCRYENPRQEELAHKSYAWTRAHVHHETKHFLAGLPFRLDLRPLGGHEPSAPRVILVHASPVANTLYWTEDRPDSFCLKMAAMAGMQPGDLIAFGHTHRPWYREVGGMHFVNTGSVGRPKDGNWQAGYVLLETGAAAPHVTFVRVDYDIERALQAIRESELPGEFAEDLRTGCSDAPMNEYITVEPKTQF